MLIRSATRPAAPAAITAISTPKAVRVMYHGVSFGSALMFSPFGCARLPEIRKARGLRRGSAILERGLGLAFDALDFGRRQRTTKASAHPVTYVRVAMRALDSIGWRDVAIANAMTLHVERQALMAAHAVVLQDLSAHGLDLDRLFEATGGEQFAVAPTVLCLGQV